MSTNTDAAAASTAPRPRSALTPGRRWVWVAAALLAQAGLAGASVAPQVSARVLGQEYRLRVAPVDPIDPFRGAYVALSYPDLPTAERDSDEPRATAERTTYVPLVRQGELWRGGTPTTTRPASGPYLSCHDRGWDLRCGIDSWFVPQKEAARLETAVRDGHAVAVVRVDDRGNAALVALRTDG